MEHLEEPSRCTHEPSPRTIERGTPGTAQTLRQQHPHWVQGNAMLIPVSANGWVPLHRIERITFWADSASVKYSDAREPEVVKGLELERLRNFVVNQRQLANEMPKRGPGRPKGARK